MSTADKNRSKDFKQSSQVASSKNGFKIKTKIISSGRRSPKDMKLDGVVAAAKGSKKEV